MKSDQELFLRTPVRKAVMRMAIPTVISSLVLVIYNMDRHWRQCDHLDFAGAGIWSEGHQFHPDHRGLSVHCHCAVSAGAGAAEAASRDRFGTGLRASYSVSSPGML